MARLPSHGGADTESLGCADPPRRTAAATIEVAVVSGVRLYAEGLTRALELDPGMTVCATLAGGRELAALLAQRRADVVVLDLPSLDDLDELRALVAREPRTPFVALAIREDDGEVLDWAEAGAIGLVTRDASLDEIKRVIRGAAHGAPPCCGAVSAALLRRVAAVARERPSGQELPLLTAREREIAQLLELGLSNKEIAARLFLGVSTVKNHVHNLLGKLEARSRAEAVDRMRRAEGLTGSRLSLPTRTDGSGAGRAVH
jgi:two-component system nitrate/nitrite response regulator NarL